MFRLLIAALLTGAMGLALAGCHAEVGGGVGESQNAVGSSR
jgi:hypothetical protein